MLNITVNVLPSVGEKKLKLLEILGIKTIEDLLNYFPFRYEDMSIKNLNYISDNERVTMQGTIYSYPVVKNMKNKGLLTINLLIDNHIVSAIWFNQNFLKDSLTFGRKILVSGKWNNRLRQITVSEYYFLDQELPFPITKYLPVYSLTADLKINWMRKVIYYALNKFRDEIKSNLPEELKIRYKLYTYKDAINAIHFPKDDEEIRQAKRRLIYEEFFFFQLKIQLLKWYRKNKNLGLAKTFSKEKVKLFIDSLHFKLTSSQNNVINEILSDLEQSYTMNRLLQGDVGTGKTIVATISLYANYLAGYQGALMVPTEILAEQHFQRLSNYLTPFGVIIEKLTGSLTEKQRKEILSQLQFGMIDIVIGTHALIQEDVYFHNLGLVITDEQHRFGVEQRAALRKKGKDVDLLYMTATPIPRTLAISSFGDMDISTLNEYPFKKKFNKTIWLKPSQLNKALQKLENELMQGRQGYAICPMIEESEKLDVQNVINIYNDLVKYFAKKFKIGLLHGKMNDKEKEHIMKEFSANNIQLLVSTTVIEVGIDVENATIMVIFDAERFGLSQLHQLRGRVGRGKYNGTTYLIADPKTEIGIERIKVLEKSSDGFEIANYDLELRGPGDILGYRQSGLPEFKIGDFIRDYQIMQVAKKDVENIIKENFLTIKDPNLQQYIQNLIKTMPKIES